MTEPSWMAMAAEPLRHPVRSFKTCTRTFSSLRSRKCPPTALSRRSPDQPHATVDGRPAHYLEPARCSPPRCSHPHPHPILSDSITISIHEVRALRDVLRTLCSRVTRRMRDTSYTARGRPSMRCAAWHAPLEYPWSVPHPVLLRTQRARDRVAQPGVRRQCGQCR